MLRSCFLVGVISCYSVGVWKLINNYFRSEYETYLVDLYKNNEHLRPQKTSTHELPPSVLAEVDVKESPSSSLSLDKTFKSLPISDDSSAGNENEESSHSHEKLDYDNRQLELETNNQHKEEKEEHDGDFINYWLKPRKDNHADNNPAYCHIADEATSTCA